MTSTLDAPADLDDVTLELDAVVLGAGVAGLYQLHQLREQGLRVRAFDSASDVGGTWYWNRYPGARFDSEGYIYQYLFSEELYKDWSWSERFPGQPEIEQWLHYVADRLDLRRDIQFSTTITSAHFDEDRGRWTVGTDRGDTIDTQFFVTCAGMLSAPMDNLFAGQDSFGGDLPHLALAEGARRAGRQARRRGRHRGHRHPGDPDDRRPGRAPDGLRPHPAVRPADEEPEVRRGGAGWLQGPIRGAARTLPHTFTGFEYDFEHAWADCRPERRQRDPRGDLPGRVAEAVAGRLRRDVLRARRSARRSRSSSGRRCAPG